jgi:hypothetical protein
MRQSFRDVQIKGDPAGDATGPINAAMACAVEMPQKGAAMRPRMGLAAAARNA